MVGSDDIGGGQFPFPCRGPSRHWDHIDAIDRAGLDTEITTGALFGNNGVHLFCRAENGVDRAGLDAFCAADAFVFAYISDLFYVFDAVFIVEWSRFNIE